jgi:hypothetical protein
MLAGRHIPLILQIGQPRPQSYRPAPFDPVAATSDHLSWTCVFAMCGLADGRTDSTGVLALRGAWGEKSPSVLCGSTSVGLQPGTFQAITTTLSRCYLLIFFSSRGYGLSVGASSLDV